MHMFGNSVFLAAASGFVWRKNIRQILITALLSMVPAYEGRYTIPVALKLGMPAFFAYLLAFVASSIPLPFILLLLRPVLDWFYTLPIKPVRKFAAWVEERAHKKHAEMKDGSKSGLMRFLSSEKAELAALYIFVALPLPGTGVWTGSAIATLLHMPRGKSAVAILLGNATACLIMTLLSTGVKAFFWFVTNG